MDSRTSPLRVRGGHEELEYLLSLRDLAPSGQGLFADRQARIAQLDSDLRQSIPSQGGDPFGPYTLEKHLGNAGVTERWLVRSAEGARLQAWILSQRALGDPAALRCFRQGSKSAELLGSAEDRPEPVPRIVFRGDLGFVLDVGEHGLVDEQLLRGLPPSARLAAFLEIARALAWAHRKGVLHLGLAPSSILAGPASRPLIVGFGLTEPRSEGLSSCRRGDLNLFVAPELLLDARGACARSDVFGLGRLLSWFMRAHLPAPLGSLGPGSSEIRALPASLAGIVERACLVHLQDRYPGVQALVDDLCQARSWSRRLRPQLPYLLAAASVVILGALALWRPWS